MIARTSTTLDRLPQGHSGHIAEITGDANGRRRLQELGLIPGAPIRLVGSAPLRDPMEFDLGGYRLSLRRSQAAQVHLSTDSVAAHQRLAWREVVQPATPLNTQQQPQAGKELVVALVGNPNAGKSTLFNAITGLRQRVGNFPGVTVDRYEGRAPLPGNRQARIIDLPGTYSLVPTSPDEAVTMGVLAGHCADIRQVDVLCAVVDATNLTRNLMLVTQLLETGLPVVVALTMMDMARKRGLAVDHQALAKHLGVPVVPVVAHRGEGLVALAKALAGDAHQASEFPWQAASHLTEAVAAITESLQTSGYQGPCLRAQARNLLLGDDHLLPPAMRQQSSMLQTLTKVRQTLADQGIDPVADDIASRYAWIRGLLPIVTPQAESGVDAHRRRGIDRVLLHPLWGLMVFGVVMWALFAVIFTVADPIMGLFEEGGTALAAWLGALLPSGAVQDMWNEGVAPGVGGVVVFLPQIALLLMLVALLEHSGYLARASYLLDRPLALVGLHGRSFVPMLTSHACAIPGIMAARGIEHPRDRLATMLVAPFMACGARLPVYLLLVGLLFSAYPTWVQGTILFSLYVMGIVAAVLISLLLKVTLLRGGGSSFVIELPDYRIPPWREVLRAVLSGSGQFLKKAGTLILAFSILLWAGLTYPKLDEAQTAQIIERHGLPSEALESAAYADHLVHHDLAAAGIEHSAVGRFGHLIEPLIEPLGYDWKIGVGLVGAFAAREVFVSTMGVVYGVGEVEDETQPLAARMGEEVRPDGSPRYSLLLGISLLVWFVLAMQCVSTVAVMWRETKSWRWPLMQLVGMNTMAYIVCLAIWQIGTRL